MRTTMTMRLTQSVRGICFHWCGFVTLDFRYGFVQRHHHYKSDSVGFSTFSPFELPRLRLWWWWWWWCRWWWRWPWWESGRSRQVASFLIWAWGLMMMDGWTGLNPLAFPQYLMSSYKWMDQQVDRKIDCDFLDWNQWEKWIFLLA